MPIGEWQPQTSLAYVRLGQLISEPPVRMTKRSERRALKFIHDTSGS